MNVEPISSVRRSSVTGYLTALIKAIRATDKGGLRRPGDGIRRAGPKDVRCTFAYNVNDPALRPVATREDGASPAGIGSGLRPPQSARRATGCVGQDLNLRTPTRQDPESCAFDQAWQPTHAADVPNRTTRNKLAGTSGICRISQEARFLVQPRVREAGGTPRPRGPTGRVVAQGLGLVDAPGIPAQPDGAPPVPRHILLLPDRAPAGAR